MPKNTHVSNPTANLASKAAATVSGCSGPRCSKIQANPGNCCQVKGRSAKAYVHVKYVLLQGDLQSLTPREATCLLLIGDAFNLPFALLCQQQRSCNFFWLARW